MRTRLRATAIVTMALLLTLGVAMPASADRHGSPLNRVISILLDPTFGLPEIKAEIRAIEAKLTPVAGPIKRSTGPFYILPGAVSVDWVVANRCGSAQAFTMTVYQRPVGGPAVAIAPGPLTLTVAAEGTSHNANSVGASGPFRLGFSHEMVLVGAACLLPSVEMWSSMSATDAMAGGRIPSAEWVPVP